jgi:hypothetical protein
VAITDVKEKPKPPPLKTITPQVLTNVIVYLRDAAVDDPQIAIGRAQVDDDARKAVGTATSTVRTRQARAVPTPSRLDIDTVGRVNHLRYVPEHG